MGISLFSTLEAFGGGRENAEKEGRTEANREGKEVGEADRGETENWRGGLPRACVGPDASDLADLEAGEAAAWKYDVMRGLDGFGEGVRGGVGGQAMLAFSNGLHTDLGVAIGRREGFGATGREAISAHDIGFLGVATDEESDGVSGEDVLSERSRTISGVGIERGRSFDDVENEKITDRDDETGEIGDEATDSTNC
ncbi:hypothetical protein G7Y79_00059g091950 [Physcia stellaris]|nr:hypothetical protein G7Y79_00059g091950 [Physcia stellaris]